MSAKARSSERKPACWSGRVGVDDRGDGHVGQVVPLGDHLGAQQDRRARAGRTRPAGGPRRRAREALEPSMRTSRAGRHQPRERAPRPPALPAPAARCRRRCSAGRRRAPRSSCPQWWHTRRRGAVVVDEGDVAVAGSARSTRTSRQRAISEKPRRLARTIAFSPRSGRLVQRRGERPRDGPGPLACACPRSPPGGSGEPSARPAGVSRGSACQVSGRGVALP